MEIAAFVVSLIALFAVGFEIFLNHFAKQPYARVYVSEYCAETDPPETAPKNSDKIAWFEVTVIVSNPRKSDLLIRDASIFCGRDAYADELPQEISVGPCDNSPIRLAPESIQSLKLKMRSDVMETTLGKRDQVPLLHVRLLTPKGEAVLTKDIAEILNNSPTKDLWEVVEVKNLNEIRVGPKRLATR